MDIRRTVLLADANEEFRTLVRKIIDEAEEFSVVGSVGDGTEALRLAREEAPYSSSCGSRRGRFPRSS